ncbi:MAG: Uma2 family endonuclease [Gammaproteobacteria bacterium]|nr:Uma2 family endonuclease [Gammaproteobacteria bacterium]
MTMALAYLEHYTFRDYQQWEGDWELIYGAPYAMAPSPSISHQRIERSILVQLDEGLKHCAQCEVLSEVDWQSSDDTVVRPDVLVACDINGERLTTTPELIVEIVSDTSAKRDEQIKFELYEKEGVKWYLLVYPDDPKVKVFRWHEGRYIKEADFTNQLFDFTLRNCRLTLDFARIWRN